MYCLLMIATIPLATGNKLNCFTSMNDNNCLALCSCCFFCVLFVDFYMLTNHLKKEKKCVTSDILIKFVIVTS